MPDLQFTVNRDGVDHLLHDLNGPLGQTIAQLCNRAVNYAKADTPVDTGNLRASEGYEITVEDGEITGLVYARASYAIYVHDGTRYRQGHPFLQDAVNRVLSEL